MDPAKVTEDDAARLATNHREAVEARPARCCRNRCDRAPHALVAGGELSGNHMVVLPCWRDV